MTILLPWVWAYVNKEDPLTGGTIQKLIGSCNAMNGGPQYGAAITLTETDVMCVEQLVHWLVRVISAAMDLICKGYGTGNAFAEALAEHLGKDPISDGYAITVQKALL